MAHGGQGNISRRLEQLSIQKGQKAQSYDDTGYGQLPTLRDVEIARSCLQLGQELGEGYFGTVMKGRLKDMGLTVAIKIMKEDKMPARKFLDEARTMHKLKHDNLVKLIGVCREKSPFLIITEYMCNGDLGVYLQRHKGFSIKIERLTNFAYQIANGMEYLGSKGFVHRDLRSANVLVGKNYLVKVADFGLVRLVDAWDTYSGGSDSRFPIRWTAPEARAFRTFTSKSDVWSFGALLYEMITYGERPPFDMQENVLQKPKPAQWPTQYFNCMSDCLNDNPDKRPTFSALKKIFAA